MAWGRCKPPGSFRQAQAWDLLSQMKMKEHLPPTLEGLAPVTRNTPAHHLKQGVHRETCACFDCFLPFVLITCEYDFSTEVPRTALVTAGRRAAQSITFTWKQEEKKKGKKKNSKSEVKLPFPHSDECLLFILGLYQIAFSETRKSCVVEGEVSVQTEWPGSRKRDLSVFQTPIENPLPWQERKRWWKEHESFLYDSGSREKVPQWARVFEHLLLHWLHCLGTLWNV